MWKVDLLEGINNICLYVCFFVMKRIDVFCKDVGNYGNDLNFFWWILVGIFCVKY